MAPKKIAVIIAGLGVVLIGAVFLPVSYERTIRDGTDSFGTHHALWGDRVKTVTETTQSDIQEVGLIFVNLRRAQSLAPVTVVVSSPQQGVIATKEVTLPATVDDEFTWLSLGGAKIDAGNEYTVAASAPLASREFPVGVRFQEEDKQLALSVRERIPRWEYILRWTQEHDKQFSTFVEIIKHAVVLAICVFVFERIAQNNKKLGTGIALLVLVIVVLYYKLPVSHAVDSAYGGDAFNYILKGNAWIVGEDPFAADPRKAPLYPFLLAPGLLPGIDPLLWARGVSIAASLGLLVLVVLFLMRLGAPLAVSLGGAFLLAANRDFQFETIQGLSNTLYAALIMAASYAFVSSKRYLVSVFSALAALTRYEGAAVAGILIPSLWLTHRGKVSQLVREAIPFIVLISIPFLLTPLTGNVGVRTISDITSDEGLYVAHTWEYFLPSIQAFKLFFGRMWILTQNVGDVFLVFGYGVLAGICGILLYKKIKYLQSLVQIIPAIIFLFLLHGALFGFDLKTIIAFFSALTGFGVAVVCVLRPKVCIPIVLMVLVQTAVITAILPKNRYYLQIIPFLAMAIAGALYMVGGGKNMRKLPYIFSVFSLCLAVSILFQNAGDALSGQISEYNEKSAVQTVMVDAGRYLKNVSGNVALYNQNDLMLRAYLPEQRLVSFLETMQDTDEQFERMQQLHVEYFVEASEAPYFAKLIAEKPEAFEEIAVYKTRWSDVSATLYRVY